MTLSHCSFNSFIHNLEGNNSISGYKIYIFLLWPWIKVKVNHLNKLSSPAITDDKCVGFRFLAFIPSEKKIFEVFSMPRSQWPTFSSKVYDLNKLEFAPGHICFCASFIKICPVVSEEMLFLCVDGARMHGHTHAAPCHKLTWPLARWAKKWCCTTRT